MSILALPILAVYFIKSSILIFAIDFHLNHFLA